MLVQSRFVLVQSRFVTTKWQEIFLFPPNGNGFERLVRGGGKGRNFGNDRAPGAACRGDRSDCAEFRMTPQAFRVLFNPPGMKEKITPKSIQRVPEKQLSGEPVSHDHGYPIDTAATDEFSHPSFHCINTVLKFIVPQLRQQSSKPSSYGCSNALAALGLANGFPFINPSTLSCFHRYSPPTISSA